MEAAAEPVLVLMAPLFWKLPPPLTLNCRAALPCRETLAPMLIRALPPVELVVAVKAPPSTLKVAVPVPVWAIDRLRLAPVETLMAPPLLLRKAVPPPGTSIVILLVPVPALRLIAVAADEAEMFARLPPKANVGVLIVSPAPADTIVSITPPFTFIDSLSAWALKVTLPELAVRLWLPANVRLLPLPPVTLIEIAEAAFVAPVRVMVPVPVFDTSKEPVLLMPIVPVALLVVIEPELVRVPPAMLTSTEEELEPPVGAVADMVPELRKVPAPIVRETVEVVPLEALVDSVPLLETDVEVLVKVILLPVVVKLPELLKLPVPIVTPMLPAALSEPALLKPPEPRLKLKPWLDTRLAVD